MKLLLEWTNGSIVLDPGLVYIVGRDQSSDIHIDHSRISRSHLRIEFLENHWVAKDLSSSNGTFQGRKEVNSININKVLVLDLGGDSGVSLRFVPITEGSIEKSTKRVRNDRTQILTKGSISVLEGSVQRIKLGQRVRVGRDDLNDWRIDDLTVSRFHAEILATNSGGFYIVDLKSENGTFVNGKAVKRHDLIPGDLISVGHAIRKFTLDGLEGAANISGTEIVAEDISFQVGERILLQKSSFKLGSRTLTAIIGPSGAGKSTLLNALTGRVSLSGGNITIGGRNLESEYSELKKEIGLVPQADIMHTKLTIRQALTYGAALRLPKDVSKEERVQRVNEVLAKLELEPRADLQIAKLSGGQRKRVSIGLELLTKPELLVLDEPTSGLDPGLDAHVMETLRTLADEGQTVVVVTHAVENLDFCDNVILMASGGRIAYFGPPSTIFNALAKKTWSEVFKLLADSDAIFLQAEKKPFVQSEQDRRAIKESAKRQSWIKQTATLSTRYLSVIKSDRFYMLLLLLVPTVMGLISY